MDIIPTYITSFEEIVNNLIKEIKITGLENIRKLLEAILFHFLETKSC